MQYSEFTAKVLEYIKEQYDSEPEFLWAKNPDNAAIRYKGNKKWFAALLLRLPKRLLGFDSNDRVDVLNLKCDPKLQGSLLDSKSILPGYHMNKEHWISVLLDGSIEDSELFALVDISYSIVSKKKTK